MSQFNYYLLPTVQIPSIYYINLPTMSNLEAPVVDTITHIASEQDLRSVQPQKSSLELSRDELLAAGY